MPKSKSAMDNRTGDTSVEILAGVISEGSAFRCIAPPPAEKRAEAHLARGFAVVSRRVLLCNDYE